MAKHLNNRKKREAEKFLKGFQGATGVTGIKRAISNIFDPSAAVRRGVVPRPNSRHRGKMQEISILPPRRKRR